MPFPVTHDRHPECIEVMATLEAEVAEFRSWQDRQNGSLTRMAESLGQMRLDMGRMDEKLSTLISRQAEDRQRVDHMAAPAPASSPEAKDKPRWWYVALGGLLGGGGAEGIKALMGLLK